jgi:hypothetical protein
MPMMIRGSDMSPRLQTEAKARFVHRFTRAHRPDWCRANPNYKPQFADDADWLAHTFFSITKKGELDRRVSFCESHPTWPDGKGVWGQRGVDW